MESLHPKNLPNQEVIFLSQMVLLRIFFAVVTNHYNWCDSKCDGVSLESKVKMMSEGTSRDMVDLKCGPGVCMIK